MSSSEVQPPRTLVWITLFVMAILVVTTGITHQGVWPEKISIDTKGQPTIGVANAKVHLVLFEEPKCINCKEFNDKIFPQIKEEFIDKQLIKFTTIPVSFLSGSMDAAVAMVGVYYNNPTSPNSELFFKYVETLYRNQGDETRDWVNVKILLDFAKETSPEINLTRLKETIERESYRMQIEKNTSYGASLMGGAIMTPTLYVNGVFVRDLTYDNIAELIKAFL